MEDWARLSLSQMIHCWFYLHISPQRSPGSDRRRGGRRGAVRQHLAHGHGAGAGRDGRALRPGPQQLPGGCWRRPRQVALLSQRQAIETRGAARSGCRRICFWRVLSWSTRRGAGSYSDTAQHLIASLAWTRLQYVWVQCSGIALHVHSAVVKHQPARQKPMNWFIS